jgi:hypothetical protein
MDLARRSSFASSPRRMVLVMLVDRNSKRTACDVSRIRRAPRIEPGARSDEKIAELKAIYASTDACPTISDNRRKQFNDATQIVACCLVETTGIEPANSWLQIRRYVELLRLFAKKLCAVLLYRAVSNFYKELSVFRKLCRVISAIAELRAVTPYTNRSCGARAEMPSHFLCGLDRPATSVRAPRPVRRCVGQKRSRPHQGQA